MRADVRVVERLATCAGKFADESGVFKHAQVEIHRRQAELFAAPFEFVVEFLCAYMHRVFTEIIQNDHTRPAIAKAVRLQRRSQVVTVSRHLCTFTDVTFATFP